MKKIIFLLAVLLSGPLFSQWDTVGTKGFSNSGVLYMFTAVNPVTKEPYVVFRDNSNYCKTSVRRFDGSKWVQVGSHLGEGLTWCQSMAFDDKGNPFVIFSDANKHNGPCVAKYNGTDWEYLGKTPIVDTAVSCNSIDIDAKGIPYIVFRDGGGNYGASVMKFNGINWEFIGGRGFTDQVMTWQGSFHPSITLDKNGVPYIAYQDFTHGTKTTVQRFNGTSWELVGKPGFAGWNSQYARSLAFDSKNRPYLVCSISGHISAMRFENGDWSNVGSYQQTQGGAEFASIAIDKHDRIYIAFQDYGVARRASVIRFDGTWTYLGQKGFSPSSVNHTTIDLDNEGSIYVGFSDNSATQYKWGATVMKFRDDLKTNVKEHVKNSFNMFPNPTGSTLNVRGVSGDLYISIFDQLGRIVHSELLKNFTGSGIINLEALPKGVYIVKFKNNEIAESKQIVIE